MCSEISGFRFAKKWQTKAVKYLHVDVKESSLVGAGDWPADGGLPVVVGGVERCGPQALGRVGHQAAKLRPDAFLAGGEAPRVLRDDLSHLVDARQAETRLDNPESKRQ